MCDKYVTIYAAMPCVSGCVHLVVNSWKYWSVYLYMHIYARDRGGPCPARDRLSLMNGYIISLGFSTHLFDHTIPASYACYHGAYGIGASVMKTVMVRYVKANIQILECVKRCWADAHYLYTLPHENKTRTAYLMRTNQKQNQSQIMPCN